jgi:hypothetical protein
MCVPFCSFPPLLRFFRFFFCSCLSLPWRRVDSRRACGERGFRLRHCTPEIRPHPSVAILASVAHAEAPRLVQVAGSPIRAWAAARALFSVVAPLVGGAVRSGSPKLGTRTHASHLQFLAILTSVPRLVEVVRTWLV